MFDLWWQSISLPGLTDGGKSNSTMFNYQWQISFDLSWVDDGKTLVNSG